MKFTLPQCSMWETLSKEEKDPLMPLSDTISFEFFVGDEIEHFMGWISDYVILEYPWIMR